MNVLEKILILDIIGESGIIDNNEIYLVIQKEYGKKAVSGMEIKANPLRYTHVWLSPKFNKSRNSTKQSIDNQIKLEEYIKEITKPTPSVFDDFDTESYIKQLVMMHDYDKWDNGTYKGNMHTVVPAIMEAVRRDTINKEATPMQIEIFRELLSDFYSKMYTMETFTHANDNLSKKLEKIINEFADRLVYVFHTSDNEYRKLLMNFLTWYTHDEMLRESPETKPSVIDRFLIYSKQKPNGK